jgi:hypothetical protein
VIFLGDFSFVRIFLKNYRVIMTTTLDTSFLENTINGFVSKARVSACMYFLVIIIYNNSIQRAESSASPGLA